MKGSQGQKGGGQQPGVEGAHLCRDESHPVRRRGHHLSVVCLSRERNRDLVATLDHGRGNAHGRLRVRLKEVDGSLGTGRACIP